MTNLISRSIGKLERVTGIFRHIGAWKMDISSDEAWRILEEYSHDPKTTCYREHVETGGGGYDLSVIVPVYNTERYLRRCLDSILGQESGYRIQYIFINDGSLDNSGKILADYKNVKNVTVIEQSNEGLSGARNVGLDRAAGKYILFVDSDDRLVDGAIKKLLDMAFKHDADVVAGNFRYVDTNGKILREEKRYSTGEVRPEGNLAGFAWGKVYKAELFYNLRFPEHYWFEDSIFAQIVWPLTKRAYTISDAVYEYTSNPQGISNTSRKRAKSVDSLYITAQLMKDRQKFGLKPTEDNLKYFLRMLRLTYSRTRCCNSVIAKCIFVIQCELYKYYEGISVEEKASLQTALKKKEYVRYLLLLQLK